jgi:septal ring factor EnvC (AmiA/AmiB activator)
MRRKFAPVFLGVWLSAGLALAATDPTARVDQMQKQVRNVEQTLAKERAKQQALERDHEQLGAEITKLQKDLVRTAERAQAQEEALSQLEESLNDLETKERKALSMLERNHDSLSHILAALLRVKRQPPQAMLAIPQSPLETAHSIVLLRHMLPELQLRIDGLSQELAAIKEIETSIGERKTEMAERTEKLQAEQKNLARLVEVRQTKQTQNIQALNAQREKTELLASQAEDLRDLIQKLEAERKKRLAAAKAAKKPSKAASRAAKGEISAIAGVPLPAKGKLITNYGEKNEFGATSKGLTLETRSGAQVISPYGGEIVYAGEFRSYGLILIVEVGDGYHIMLSNLGRIDAVLGQSVTAGEPIAAMPTTTPPPRLYVEYRKAGQPVSPRAWSGPSS